MKTFDIRSILKPGLLLGASLSLWAFAPAEAGATNQSDGTNPSQQYFPEQVVVLRSVDEFFPTSPEASVEGALTIPQLVILIRETRQQLATNGDALIAAFSLATPGAGNLSDEQLRALRQALDNAKSTAARAESSFKSLEGGGGVTAQTLNANLEANNKLRAALVALVQQISALPRNGTPQSLNAAVAVVDNVEKLAQFLRTTAPALQQMREQVATG